MPEDPVMELFLGVGSRQAKEDRFDQSIARSILQWCGWTAAEARQAENERGPSFGCLELEGLLGLPFSIGSFIVPTWSVDQLLLAKRHPFDQRWEELGGADRLLVTRGHKAGKLVLTTVPPWEGQKSGSIRRRGYHIHQAKEFFNTKFGNGQEQDDGQESD